MKEIEISTTGKTDLKLLYEVAQKYCAAEQGQDILLCDFYRQAGAIAVRRVVEEQIATSDPSYIDFTCSLFSVVTLSVSVGMTFNEVRALLATFGIK